MGKFKKSGGRKRKTIDKYFVKDNDVAVRKVAEEVGSRADR